MRTALLMALILSSSVLFSREQLDIISSFYVPENLANDLPTISKEFEIVRRYKDGFIVYVQRGKLKKFRSLSLDSTLLEYDISVELMEKFKTRAYGKYHSLTEVEWLYDELVESYGEIVKVIQYGVSLQGNPLLALKISDNVDVDDKGEPDILLTAATHGDEPITTEVLINLTKELLAGYGTDKRLSKLVNDNEIYVIFTASPDAFAVQRRYTNGYDLNRSFPCVISVPPPYDELPTAKHLISFFKERDFVGSLDFHAFGQMTMFPWAFKTDRIKDEEDYNTMFNLSKYMSQVNGYEYGQAGPTIYVAYGTSGDYYYRQNGTFAFVVELGTNKMPVPKNVGKVTTEARELLWRFLESF